MYHCVSRKSQVTIFIIAGLAILAIVGVAMYLATATQQVVGTQTFRRTPTSFRDYIDICIEETATSAINNLGFQGGYLELPHYIRANDAAFISFGNRREFGVPSWFFRGDYRFPSIASMEMEISGYVEDNVHACLDDFSGYSDYNVTEREPISVDTTISPDTVSVEAYYPIDVVADRASQAEFYEDFNVRVPVKLGKMHELGKMITYSEVMNKNFERELFNLISAHPDIPITHQSFSPRQERWSLDEIQEEINLLIFYNMPRVRFQGTDYPSFDAPEREYENFAGFTALDSIEGNIPDNAPDDAYEYFNMFFDPSDLPSDANVDTRMSFDDVRAIVKYYPDDYLSVNAQPRSGGTLSTEMMRLPGIGLPFPIQMGHFTYDVDFLLEINLMDEEAFLGDGFVLRFALPVSIRSNEPDKMTDSFTLDTEPRQFEDPCDEVAGEYVIDVRGLRGGITNQPLRGAEISYDCLQFGCYLGETRSESGTFRLTTGLPDRCSGGFINVEKEGYLPVRKQHMDDEENIRIDMRKIETFTVRVDSRRSSDLRQTEPLRNDYIVVGTLDPHDYDEALAFEYVPGEPFPEIELLADDGAYDVSLYLIDTEYDAIVGGYEGEFTYDYFDSAGRRDVWFSVVEYLPRPAPVSMPENQLKILEYIEEGDYAETASPRFG